MKKQILLVGILFIGVIFISPFSMAKLDFKIEDDKDDIYEAPFSDILPLELMATYNDSDSGDDLVDNLEDSYKDTDKDEYLDEPEEIDMRELKIEEEDGDIVFEIEVGGEANWSKVYFLMMLFECVNDSKHYLVFAFDGNSSDLMYIIDDDDDVSIYTDSSLTPDLNETFYWEEDKIILNVDDDYLCDDPEEEALYIQLFISTQVNHGEGEPIVVDYIEYEYEKETSEPTLTDWILDNIYWIIIIGGVVGTVAIFSIWFFRKNTISVKITPKEKREI